MFKSKVSAKKRSSNMRFDIQLMVFILSGILLAFILGNVEARVSSDTSSSKQPVAQTTGKILPVDVTGVLNGDYSSVVGTWKSENGSRVIFDTAGQVTVVSKSGTQSKGQLYNARILDGRLEARFELSNKRIVSIFLLPKGSTTKYTGTTYASDALLVSQSISDSDEPYYRKE